MLSTFGKDLVESLERTKKDPGSGWKALIVIGWRGRIPGCLAYGWGAKWIPVESTTQPLPIDIVWPSWDRCSLLLQVGKGWSLCDL